MVVIKFAEVAHIAFHLSSIGYGYLKCDLCSVYLFHSGNHIGKLSYA